MIHYRFEGVIAQHLVNETEISLLKIYYVNHFSGLLCQLCHPLNASSELLDTEMMDLKQGFKQLNCHHTAFQIQ
jgi:hypothetical protein